MGGEQGWKGDERQDGGKLFSEKKTRNNRLRDSSVESFYQRLARTGRGKAYISDITNALIEKRGNDKTTDRAWTILTSGVKSKIKFSNLEEKTYKNFGDILEKCCRNNTPLVTTQTSCGCNLDEVRVWYTGDECGKTVYLQYKTDIKPDKDDSPMSVGNTTGREIFAHKHEDGTEYQQNGSAHYKIGPETADNVGAMNSAIEDIFVWGRSSVQTTSRLQMKLRQIATDIRLPASW